MTRAMLWLMAALATSIGSAALAADIRVMSGGAPKEVLTELVPQFERATGHKVHITYIVISAMAQKLGEGETPDMVLMPVPAIEARVKDGLFRADAWAKLAIVSVGLVVNAIEAHCGPVLFTNGVHRGLVAERIDVRGTDLRRKACRHRSPVRERIVDDGIWSSDDQSLR